MQPALKERREWVFFVMDPASIVAPAKMQTRPIKGGGLPETFAFPAEGMVAIGSSSFALRLRTRGGLAFLWGGALKRKLRVFGSLVNPIEWEIIDASK